jgi:cytochrome c6
MKRITATLAAVLALAFAAPARAEDGKALFASKCASCHGPDGKGQTKMGEKMGVKDLTQIKSSEADIEATITNGKPPKMTAYKDKLTPEQIKALATYVKGGLK